MYKQYNVMSDFQHIPLEAFLFVPFRSNHPAVRDDYKIGEAKKIRRLIFEGWA